MRILGIDPGLNKTGFSVIDMNAGSFTLITAGVFRVPKGELSSRLSHIFRCIQELAAEYHLISRRAKSLVNVNPQSTLLLGQARGAAICSAAVAGAPGAGIHADRNQAGGHRFRAGREAADPGDDGPYLQPA